MKKILSLAVLSAVTMTAWCAGAADLKSKDDVVRRSAFRKMLDSDRRQAIALGLKSEDQVIYARALLENFKDRREKALPELKKAAKSDDPAIQLLVLGCLKELPDSPERRDAAKILRSNAKNATIGTAAGGLATPFAFHREKTRLGERSDWDYAIKTISSTEIPGKNWRFATDPEATGHEKNFYDVNFDDSKWALIGVGNWEDQGFKNYDGIGWYRIVFDAPKKPNCNAAELTFGAVDEEAWVWLNGIYIGQHAIGKDGWDKTFTLDITDEIKWGERNILVVRVNDSMLGGGIWKPIKLNILQ